MNKTAEILNKSLIIAGPCSAETREQTVGSALALSQGGVKHFRAGLWKPRTRAGQFEGVGVKAMPWLLEVRERTGMKIGTEVALPAHVEACRKAELDFVWIGARTACDPFAVQDVAEALRGTDMMVWVKNPLSPELNLWIGAIDRLARCDVRKVGAIHRGFSYYDNSAYRNYPQWDIPVELRNQIPGLPLLSDPSHIGGRRDLIAPLSQYALDLGFDGLIIESHTDPDRAWSDASQQLTPAALLEMLSRLHAMRKGDVGPMLDGLRQAIDSCDERLVRLLAERMDICRRIGELKQDAEIQVIQQKRFNDILQRRIAQGVDFGLDAAFVKRIFDEIHLKSIDLQMQARQEAGGIE